MQWLMVACGGALGAMARFGVNALLFPVAGHRFPLATLVINVSGCTVMGVLYVVIIERSVLSGEWRNLLMVGTLGAYTTFSAFSLDALALWQNGHAALAALYVGLSVVLCLAGTLGGMALTRIL